MHASAALALIASVVLPSCTSVAGFHRITEVRGSGTHGILIEAYGPHVIGFDSHHSLHLGWSRHVLVYPADAREGMPNQPYRFQLAARLPDSEPVHVSVASVGVEAAWSRDQRGISLGVHSRSFTRLPVDRSLSWQRLPESEHSPETYHLSDTP